MAEDRETRAGVLSGIVAIAMIVALSLMAMTALGTGPEMIIASSS